MVTLRKLQLDDLDAVHALISRMDVVRYMCSPYVHRSRVKNSSTTRFRTLLLNLGNRSSERSVIPHSVM